MADEESGSERVEQIIREMVTEALLNERLAWEAKIDAAEALAAELKDGLVRCTADFANHKRRAAEAEEVKVRNAIGGLLEDFLPLGDNLDRAAAAASGDAKIYEGIAMVRVAFTSAIAKHGIELIDTVGIFNPEVHEAVGTEETVHGAGVILDVLEQGYTWRGRLLKPAKVIVST